MMKKVLSILLVMVMAAGFFAVAETAVKSVTASEIVSPSGEVLGENFIIYLPPVEPETIEHEVMEEIIAFVQETPVVEYFAEETVAAVIEKLPETVQVENLTLDEFFPLREVGYEEHYGEVEAVFEFAVRYKDTDVVIALVGVPSEQVVNDRAMGGKGHRSSFRDEKGIEWTPMDTRVSEGRVHVKFTEETMRKVNAGNAMMALLREDELAAKMG